MTKEEIVEEGIKLSLVHSNRRTIRIDFVTKYLLNVPILPRCNYYFAYFVWNLYNPDDIIIQSTGYQIHHKDKNSLNDTIDNLQKMTSFKHNSLHHKGKTISEKQRKEQSEFMKKRLISNETREKISKSNTGKKFTKEHKEKLSKAHIGKKLTKEHRENISKVNIGKIVTDETRKKLSKLHIGRKHSDEHKRKNSEARKEWWRKKKLGLL